MHYRGKQAGPQERGALCGVLGEVANISRKLDLHQDVKNRAGAICADAVAMRFDREVAHPLLAAASLYVACREVKKPVTLRELADASGTEVRDLGRRYVALLERMHISRPELNDKGYVYHLALKRPVSEQALNLSQEIINRMAVKGLGGKNPMTLAAASLYLACCAVGEVVTQAEVAEAAGVGEETVRECCKEIRALDARPPN